MGLSSPRLTPASNPTTVVFSTLNSADTDAAANRPCVIRSTISDHRKYQLADCLILLRDRDSRLSFKRPTTLWRLRSLVLVDQFLIS